MDACARNKDNVNENATIHVLLIIETSFYLENCHFGCGYKQDVFQNGACWNSRLYSIQNYLKAVTSQHKKFRQKGLD